MTLQELSNVHEESWILVQQRSKGKAQKERAGLIREKSSEIYDNGTDIAEFVEEHKAVQIEIKEGLHTQPHYAKHVRDAMGRFIVEDGLSRMMPKSKLNAKVKRQRLRLDILNRPKDDWQTMGEANSAAQKRTEQQL